MEVKVLVLRDIDKPWVGIDLRVYPPMKRGDVATIDRRTAELMERHGIVKIIDE